MLDQKYFGLSLLTWIVILVLIIYFIYCTKCRTETFTSEKSKVKVFNFNTKWCGYSKQFQPIWDSFQKKCNSKKNVEIIDVKCDDKKNENICNKYSVPGYPSILFEKDGKVIDYQGERSVDGLHSQLKKLL